jgi:hypothetical protein
LGDNTQFVDISGSNSEAADESRPTQMHMDSEAVKGLPEQAILPKSGFPTEPLAAVGPGELTDWKGEAIHQGEGWIVSDGAEQMHIGLVKPHDL